MIHPSCRSQLPIRAKHSDQRAAVEALEATRSSSCFGRLTDSVTGAVHLYEPAKQLRRAMHGNI